MKVPFPEDCPTVRANGSNKLQHYHHHASGLQCGGGAIRRPILPGNSGYKSHIVAPGSLSKLSTAAFLDARLKRLHVFAWGVSCYREGGSENLLLAADQFRNFMVFFPREPELEEFRNAAQIDIALIETQLMQSAQSDKDKLIAAQAAAKAFSSFLQKWPNDPQAPAASVSLKEIEDFLSTRR